MPILTPPSFAGGQCKTTSCLILARLLAEQGKRVLLVDADSQGSLTLFAGAEMSETTPSTLEVIRKDIEPADAVQELSEMISIIPSDRGLLAAEGYMKDSGGGARLLGLRLRKLASDWDFIIVDGPGQASTLAQAAIAASDLLCIVCTADVKGAEAMIATATEVLAMRDDLALFTGEILGVLPCRDKWIAGKRTLAARRGLEVIEAAAESYGFRLWPSVVESEAFRSAMDLGGLPPEEKLHPYIQFIEEALCPTPTSKVA